MNDDRNLIDIIEQLPSELDAWKPKFLATAKNFIRITLQATEKTRLWQSKVRGKPYQPKNEPYPLDIDGNPLILFAQINFAEMPSLPPYPHQGIIQFFISATDELYGMNLENGFEGLAKQDRFRVRYCADIITDESQLMTDFDFLHQDVDDFLPARQECSMNFELATEMISLSDYQFDQIFGNNCFDEWGDKAEQIEEICWDTLQSEGHKIGGYAYFTQEDPRYWTSPSENWLLLLQIDTDDEADIMWGDSGVGAFFIKEEDLRKKDFAHVIYNWDCC